MSLITLGRIAAIAISCASVRVGVTQVPPGRLIVRALRDDPLAVPFGPELCPPAPTSCTSRPCCMSVETLWHETGIPAAGSMAGHGLCGSDLRGSVARLEGLEPPAGCLEENQGCPSRARTRRSEPRARGRSPPPPAAAQVGGGTYVARNAAWIRPVSTFAVEGCAASAAAGSLPAPSPAEAVPEARGHGRRRRRAAGEAP